jgi:hypothetical protein
MAMGAVDTTRAENDNNVVHNNVSGQLQLTTGAEEDPDKGWLVNGSYQNRPTTMGYFFWEHSNWRAYGVKSRKEQTVQTIYNPTDMLSAYGHAKALVEYTESLGNVAFEWIELSAWFAWPNGWCRSVRRRVQMTLQGTEDAPVWHVTHHQAGEEPGHQVWLNPHVDFSIINTLGLKAFDKSNELVLTHDYEEAAESYVLAVDTPDTTGDSVTSEVRSRWRELNKRIPPTGHLYDGLVAEIDGIDPSNNSLESLVEGLALLGDVAGVMIGLKKGNFGQVAKELGDLVNKGEIFWKRLKGDTIEVADWVYKAGDAQKLHEYVFDYFGEEVVVPRSHFDRVMKGELMPLKHGGFIEKSDFLGRREKAIRDLFEESVDRKTLGPRDIGRYVGGNYLLYKFAIEPLIGEIQNKMEKVKDVDLNMIYRKNTSEESHGVNSFGSFTTELRVLLEAKHLERRFGNYARMLDFWGVLPSLNRAWGLFPLSFVIDWFYPVGQVLSRYDSILLRSPRLEIVRRVTSVKWEQEFVPVGYEGDVTVSVYKRYTSVFPDYSIKKPNWQFGSFWNDPGKVVTASLLIERFSDDGRSALTEFKRRY